uniref:F-box domain-containing protein n=1 Tax=Heterorhabditis bacteriophora TaxID=37862 RepID=A0A1I7WAN8_HETBA
MSPNVMSMLKLAKNQISQCCWWKVMKTNLSMLDFAFLGLPPELQCHILRQISIGTYMQLTSAGDMRQLKTQMTSSDIRHLKLVSKDMKYLIERDGQHLTKQNVSSLSIDEFVPGVFKFTAANMRWEETVSFGDFSRIFAHCHFNSIWIIEYLCENKITCEMLVFNSCNINDEDILTIVDRLLGATEANNLSMLGYRNGNVSFEKEFFRMPSVRKVCHCLNPNSITPPLNKLTGIF